MSVKTVAALAKTGIPAAQDALVQAAIDTLLAAGWKPRQVSQMLELVSSGSVEVED